MHRLFDELAHRYDLHTPPDHYRHDHNFVIEQALALAKSPCRMLDVGCGTGVLVEKARKAGIEATGIDSSSGMVREARARAGNDVITECRMQELDEEEAFDFIVSLSWTINYCASRADLRAILRRIRRALRPGGRVLLQVAHAPSVDGRFHEDREPGPGGENDDVVLFYRFTHRPVAEPSMLAEYVYLCKSLGEFHHEQHVLQMTNAHAVAACAREAGLCDIQIMHSNPRDSLMVDPSPFISCVRGPSAA